MLLTKIPLLSGSGLRSYLRRVPPNCVLYTPGQENGIPTAQDYSGNNNNGIITGALWVRTASGLWYQNYDGSDDRTKHLQATPLEAGTGSWTVEVWVRMSTSAQAYQYPAFKGGDANANAGYCFYRVEAAASLFFSISDGVNPYKTSPNGGNIADGVWRHLVGVVDRTNARLKLYINGAEIGSPGTDISTFTSSITNAARDLDQGSKTGTLSLSGGLKLVRVYNVAVSASVIASHYGQERGFFRV